MIIRFYFKNFYHNFKHYIGMRNCMVLSRHTLDLFDKMTMWLHTKIWQLAIVNVTKKSHFSLQLVRDLLQYENKGTK